jgi:hypothetical protein
LGQTTKVLATEKLETGDNNAVYDLSDVPRGNYILVVKAGNTVVTKPVIKL